MLDFDIILNAKARLPKDAQIRLENRAKSLLDQITTLQIPLLWLKDNLYASISEQIHNTYRYGNEFNGDPEGYETVREFYTNNQTVVELLSSAEIRTCWINNGHNGYVIACPSSQKDGLLFYLEAGIILCDHRDALNDAETEIYTYLHTLEKSGEHNEP
jgi:hypothetical protein